MKKSKKNMRKIVLFVALLLLLVAGAFYIYKKAVSADAWGTIPSWIDAETANKVNNVWSAAQKQQFFGCTSNGYPVKSTLTSAEITRFGANSVAFVGQNRLATDQYYQYPFYQSRYRLIVTPLFYQTDNGTTRAKFKFTIKNPTSVNNNMKLVQIRLTFWHVDQYDTYTDGSPHYSAADQIINFTGDNALVLAPNQEIAAESNLLTMTNESYYTVAFSSELYDIQNGQIIWTGYGSGSPVYCIANPISIALLRAMNSSTTTPLPSVTSTATVVSSSTPTVTTTATTAPTSTASLTTGADISLRRGFNAIGSSVPLNRDYIASNGLYLYEFVGDWKIFPGDDSLQPRAFRGYYVYAREAKIIRLNYNTVTPASFSVGSGWNMLWTPKSKTLDSLSLTINGVTKTAQNWINQGILYEKIFMINDDSATQACNYFSVLARTALESNCASQTPSTITSLTPGKTFWVYVN